MDCSRHCAASFIVAGAIVGCSQQVKINIGCLERIVGGKFFGLLYQDTRIVHRIGAQAASTDASQVKFIAQEMSLCR